MAALQTVVEGLSGAPARPLIEEPRPPDLRVLLVRHVDGLDMIDRDLRHRGAAIELTTVGSLLDAAAALEAETFDAMLVDLDLPDAPRSMVSDVLFTHPSDTPIVVLDRTGDEDRAIELIRRGAQDVLVTSMADVRTIARSLAFAVARHDYELHVRDVRTRLDAIVQEVADRHRFEPLEIVQDACEDHKQLGAATSELRATLRRAAALLNDTELLVDGLAPD